MTDQTPSGGVGPLHEAVAALPVMWHGPKDATVGNGLVAYVPRGAVLRVVGTQLHAEIDALPHGWAETGADDGQGHREGFEAVAYADVLVVVAALLGHPDAH